MEKGFDRQTLYGTHTLRRLEEQYVSSFSQNAVTVYYTKEQLNMI